MNGITIPDMSHYIVAWRAWVVPSWCPPPPPQLRPPGLRPPGLRSLCTDTWWPYKQAVEAACRKGEIHAAPTYSCQCGFWGINDLGALITASVGFCATVLGRVALWGRVVEHTLGYRAQFAYPLELWIHERLPPRDREEIDGYCVPVYALEEERLLDLGTKRGRVDPYFTSIVTMVEAIKEVTHDADWRAQARDRR